MDDKIGLVCFILSLVALAIVAVRVFGRHLFSRFAPVRTVKAQVVDKFKNDHFTKIYGPSHPTAYTVVFEAEGKKRSFRVSEFSYNGYKLKEKGTLKYQGSRLIDFH